VSSYHAVITVAPEIATKGFVDAPVLLFEGLTAVKKVTPPSVDLETKMSKLANMSSYHATITVLPEIATEGLYDPPVLLEKLTGVVKFAPPSIDLAVKMSKFPAVSSCHEAMTVAPEMATAAPPDTPALLERLTGVEKVPPPSVDLATKTSKFVGVSSYQITITVSPEITTEGS